MFATRACAVCIRAFALWGCGVFVCVYVCVRAFASQQFAREIPQAWQQGGAQRRLVRILQRQFFS